MQRTRIELDDDDEQEEEEEQQAEMVEPRLLDSQTDKETTKTTWCKAYAYNCRCGGQYLVDDDSEKQREREQQEQQEESKASEMIVECSECSLVIIVKSDDNL
ncbi:CG2911 [Drosophila busckii]|uniref:CG2911 n=1 Tax=Drosophila busckii TaxID=30019 RepID=A0A0M3QX61_DROBS|nr:CG2911 [Drosophila busckii]